MKIVQLNPFHYPYMGGIEHRIHNIAKRLGSKHEVIVLTARLPGTKADENMDGYRVIRLTSNFMDLYNPPYVRTDGIKAALDKLDPDVIDFHYRWAPSYTRAFSSYEGPKVFTFHNTYGEGAGLTRSLSVLNDMLFMRHLIQCQRIVCVSEFVMNDLISRGIPAKMMEAIPNGIEAAKMPSIESDHILFVGRLVNTKGLPYLIKAMKQVDGRLLIVGSGPERARLERMVETLGLKDNVEFLGKVDEDRKHRLLSECLAFIMPSTFESYGIAAAEAMTYGKPVIATKIGGLPEVVDGGGILVPPKDPQALADAMNLLLSNVQRRRSLGAIAKQKSERYSWDTVAAEMERIYSEAASCQPHFSADRDDMNREL